MEYNMKKIFGIILLLITFVMSADVKPFNFENINQDSISQQEEFDYMLKYKLFGRDYLEMGRRVIIPDKSGWNGSANYISSAEGISLGGTTLAGTDITLGDGCQLTTGPIHANSLTVGNDNGQHLFAGTVCLNNINVSSNVQAGITRAGGVLTNICTDVPNTPINLSIPTIIWPDTISGNNDITISTNNGVAYIDVPDGTDTYDIYLNKIYTGVGGTNGSKVYIRMQDGGRLTRIFVHDIQIGNHTTFNVVYRTENGDEIQTQKQYRGNVMFYSDNDITFDNTDNVPIQGTFISYKKISLKCNLDFAGQLLANQLYIGNDFKGENFKFVPFDADTLDLDPELNKDGGLRENDSTVVIPIRLSDTATVNVYFNYCFVLDGNVTTDDFNLVTDFPICGIDKKTVVIPTGQRVPTDTIKINVKKDTLIEPNEYLVMNISIESGAILPNNKTDGELKIKIIDAMFNYHTELDTTAKYSFDENKTGIVDTIKVINKNDYTRYILDSAYTNRYKLDSITGVLTLIDNPLDYEKSRVDTIKVTVIDNQNIPETGYIVIKVNDINEPPVVTDTVKTIDENKIDTVAIVSGKDPENEKILYEIDNDKFNIDSNGVITNKEPFDYEKTKVEKIIVTVSDGVNKVKDTLMININNVNEPLTVNDTTLTVPENYIGEIGKVIAKDEDNDKIIYTISDTTRYSIDSTGKISIKIPFDYETTTNDSVKVYVTDGEFTDTAIVKIKVKDEKEKSDLDIIHTDTRDSVYTTDTVYTNNQDIEIWYDLDKIRKSKDTTVHNGKNIIEICEVSPGKDTKGCDTVVVFMSDAAPIITVTTVDADTVPVDGLTIEELINDDNIYVNNKKNDIKVTVLDTVTNTKESFIIKVELDTLNIPTKNYKTLDVVFDEAKINTGDVKYEVDSNGETIVTYKDTIDNIPVTLTAKLDNKGNVIVDTTKVEYLKKINGKEVTFTYYADIIGKQIGEKYTVSYNTKDEKGNIITISYNVVKGKIVANSEGNIGYTVSYTYTNKYGNTGSSDLFIILDDVKPKVEIISPINSDNFNTNSCTVVWLVDGVEQDTLNLQRLEKGINKIIRSYKDKAGNITSDTVIVFMKNGKDIEVKMINPVTEINEDKVKTYYNEHPKAKDSTFRYVFVDPANDTMPEPIGIGLKIDMVMPSVSPTGGLATIDDILQTINGQKGIMVDKNGNLKSGTSTGRDGSYTISVDDYINEHCTEEFVNNYKKSGIEQSSLWHVKYNMHLWVYTNQSNYVNDYKITIDLDDVKYVNEAGMLIMMFDIIPEEDGLIKGFNGHALGTSAYITKLDVKTINTLRCDLPEQEKGSIVKKSDNDMKIFGYKRPAKN